MVCGTQIDRRCTVNVRPAAQGYSFKYSDKMHLRRTEEAVHRFFLQEYHANRLETVKLCFPSTSYYLHFTLDEPETFKSKAALRKVISRECDGAWIEMKGNKKQYFLDTGLFFSKIEKVTKDRFLAKASSNTAIKIVSSLATVAFGALGLGSRLIHKSTSNSRVGLISSSIFFSNQILAQQPAFGQFLINQDTSGWQYGPASLASLKDGGFIAAWYLGVHGQRYDVTGIPNGSEFTINTDGFDGNQPRAAVLKDGGVVVVWYGGPIGYYTIYGRRYDASGLAMGLQFPINGTIGLRNPDVASLDDGGYIVCWHDGHDSFCNRFNASDVSLSSQFQINTNTTRNQVYPKVAAAPQRDSMIIWWGLHTGNYDIYGRIYSTSSMSLGPEFRINSILTGDQIESGIAALSDGRYVLVWQGNQAGSWDIYAKVYNSLTSTLSQEFRVNNQTVGDQTFPWVAGLTGGGFVVAWQDEYLNTDVYAQRYDALSVPINSQFLVNNITNGFQGKPSITGLNNGGFVIAWQDDRPTGDIYGQRYDANGQPIPAVSILSSSPLNTVQSTSIVSSLSTTTPYISNSYPSIVPSSSVLNTNNPTSSQTAISTVSLAPMTSLPSTLFSSWDSSEENKARKDLALALGVCAVAIVAITAVGIIIARKKCCPCNEKPEGQSA